MIIKSEQSDFDEIYEILNDAASAYYLYVKLKRQLYWQIQIGLGETGNSLFNNQ